MATWIAPSKWLVELMAGSSSGCGTREDITAFRFLLQINSGVHFFLGIQHLDSDSYLHWTRS